MTKDVNIYDYAIENEIRTIYDNHGEKWFIGSDLCKLLGFGDNHTRKYVSENNIITYENFLEINDKQRDPNLTKLPPKTLLINEIGLYMLSQKSNVDIAIKLQDWICEKLLPSIRKNHSEQIDNKIESEFKYNHVIEKEDVKYDLPVCVYKNIDISELAICKQDLNIQQFINEIKFDIEKLRMDKFWHNIENEDTWIYINKEIGEWMGMYNEKDVMGNIYQSCKKCLMENEDFILYENFNEFKTKYLNVVHPCLKPDEINKYECGNRSKYLITKTKSFKKWMMRLRTDKGDEICNYFIKLEELFKLYIKYQSIVDKFKLQYMSQQNNFLKSISNIKYILPNNLQNRTEYVYIMSTKEELKNGIIKIGESIKEPKKRGAQLNTGRLDKLEVYHNVLTYDAKHLEKRIHHLLSFANLEREIFKLPYKNAQELIDRIRDRYHEDVRDITEFFNVFKNLSYCPKWC